MEWQELVASAYEHVLTVLERVLEGLSQEDLDWQPKPDCNSIGWLAWHLTRQEDATISFMMRENQLWLAEKWHEKFNRPANPMDFGTGQTIEQAAEFKSPDVATFLGYQRAVMERAKKFIATLSPSDMDRVLKVPGFDPPPTVGSWLVSSLGDALQHAGQAGYVRGLRKGIGWQKA